MAEPLKIELPKLNLQIVQLGISGTSPLICHAWAFKARRAMLDKQMKRATNKREAKDPERDYEDSLYKLDNGKLGFPAAAFKNAMVGACRFADAKMTEVRGAVHVLGEMVEIVGAPSPREDMVRLNGLTADIRFRGEFKEWRATLIIQFNANVISTEQVINLLNTAGFSIGVGEWRPEKNGSFGRFSVTTEEQPNGEIENSTSKSASSVHVASADKLSDRRTKSRRGARQASRS